MIYWADTVATYGCEYIKTAKKIFMARPNWYKISKGNKR